jgi:hypothetical protein
MSGRVAVVGQTSVRALAVGYRGTRAFKGQDDWESGPPGERRTRENV